MRIFGREPWWEWSRVLVSVGVTGCLVLFLWSLALIGYYSSARSFGPSPQRGWTVPLPWTHGYYGTFLERERMLQLHDWFFPFLLIAVAGSVIEQLHKKKEPWTNKQF
jgi:hypothetical protein